MRTNALNTFLDSVASGRINPFRDAMQSYQRAQAMQQAQVYRQQQMEQKAKELQLGQQNWEARIEELTQKRMRAAERPQELADKAENEQLQTYAKSLGDPEAVGQLYAANAQRKQAIQKASDTSQGPPVIAMNGAREALSAGSMINGMGGLPGLAAQNKIKLAGRKSGAEAAAKNKQDINKRVEITNLTREGKIMPTSRTPEMLDDAQRQSIIRSHYAEGIRTMRDMNIPPGQKKPILDRIAGAIISLGGDPNTGLLVQRNFSFTPQQGQASVQGATPPPQKPQGDHIDQLLDQMTPEQIQQLLQGQ